VTSVSKPGLFGNSVESDESSSQSERSTTAVVAPVEDEMPKDCAYIVSFKAVDSVSEDTDEK